MKRLTAVVSAFTIIVVFSLQSGSNTGFASKPPFSSPLPEKFIHIGTNPATEEVKPGNVKVPDKSGPDQSRPGQSPTAAGTNSQTIPGKEMSAEASKLVVIDPGHGGIDPGTSGNGVVEKDIALDVSLRLNSLLVKSGVNTYMIRTDDTYIDHKERIRIANSKDAALYLSIHCDWFKDSYFSGTTTLYYPSASLSSGKLSEIDYAETIQSSLMSRIETKNRGIIDRADLAVLRLAKMPSVLVELGFLSNKGDAALLASENFRQKVAEGLAEGIKKSLLKISGK